MDLFDYKPRLYKEHNKPLPFKEREVQFANRANIMKPPWDFRQSRRIRAMDVGVMGTSPGSLR